MENKCFLNQLISFAHDLLHEDNAFTQKVIDHCGENGLQINEILRQIKKEGLQKERIEHRKSFVFKIFHF